MTFNRNAALVFWVLIGALAIVAGAVSLTPRRQTMACVASGTCLPSYQNTLVCKSLPIGTTEKELVFRLGQPIGRAGGILYFEAGATEPGPINIELDSDRKAIRFNCRPPDLGTRQ